MILCSSSLVVPRLFVGTADSTNLSVGARTVAEPAGTGDGHAHAPGLDLFRNFVCSKILSRHLSSASQDEVSSL